MFASLLLSMATREVVEEQEFPIQIHGSLVPQELLFNKLIKVVNSLLAMEPGKLRQLLSDPRGSHVTDRFVGSTTVGKGGFEDEGKDKHRLGIRGSLSEW